MKVLYVTSSSFSGSTLLAFLLNTHPEISTVSEMIGWEHEQGESFSCSCGNALETCPLFTHIDNAMCSEGLPFEFHRFGTEYALAKNEAVNRYLTQSLPYIQNTTAERLRDAVVAHLPWFSTLLKQCDRINLTFVRAALEYKNATVFADVSKDPYRLRFLGRVSGFELSPLYLVRDPRGVTLSTMEARNWDAGASVNLWLRDQSNILRILNEFPSMLHVYYEDLCDSLDETLAAIHEFVGLTPSPLPHDFKSVEHHILGNVMRLQSGTEIRKSEKWKTRLSTDDLAVIVRALRGFTKENPQHQLTEIINYYLN